jgi:hypothetical protein
VEGPFSLFLVVCCCVVVVVFGVLTTLSVVPCPALYPPCFRPPLLNAKTCEVVFEKNFLGRLMNAKMTIILGQIVSIYDLMHNNIWPLF